jgi:twinkle protein
MAQFIEHTNCNHCGSSDANAVYEDGSTYCFSCGKASKPSNEHKETRVTDKKNKPLYYKGEVEALKSRSISLDTAKKFKVRTDEKGNTSFPLYNKSGQVVATKVRKAGTKEFAWTGEKKEAQLFGMHTFGEGGKYLTVVEGQEDCMAAFEMLGSKWPVISVHSATEAPRNIKENLDYIESFENVVFMMDSDEVGVKAAEKCAEILSPGKAKIVTLSKYKDANDYLKAGRKQDFQAEFWNQKTYSSVGVVSFEDVWDTIVAKKNTKIIPLPRCMPKLSHMMGGGVAKGEITTVGALTSIGKTTFINNLLHGFLTETDCKVGYLGLETTVGELSSGLIDLEAKKRVSDSDSLDEAEEVYKGIKWKKQLSIIDHQGSLELDSMIKKMHNSIKAFDLDVFILDPLQASLPDLNNDTVKFCMDSILKLAKQTDVAFLLVSHMKKPSDDKPHAVSEYDLLGSSSINQISFNTILLSRDKMGETDEIKSSTCLKLVKCRRTGRTGEAGWLYYNLDTGVLEEGSDPYEEFGDV